MVYAITIAVVGIFFIAYLLTREKPREVFYECLNEDEYLTASKQFIRLQPLPEESGNINDKYYKRNIRLSNLRLKQKKYKRLFADFLESEQQIQVLLKTKYDKLSELPSIDGEARCVKLARFCLANSDYIFISDRVKTLFDEQNRMRTLTFPETMAMKEAFLYVLLEKCYYIFQSLTTLTKAMKIAKKYVNDNGNVFMDKVYKEYAKSKLFLSLCAIEANYSGETHKKAFADVIDCLYHSFSRVLDSVQSVLYYDFSVHYSPLEIFDKFENFSNATETQKINFLTLFSKLSDKENLDEFMYAIRAEKYMDSSSSGHVKVTSVNVLGNKFCVIRHKQDMSMLAASLRNDIFMKVYFDNEKASKNRSSISKIVDFENTFEPIYKFSNVNFGLSTQNGILKISPHLPKNIMSANVIFQENGTEHQIQILKGNEEKIYLGNTQIKGTHLIKLSDKPMQLKVIVKK